MKKHLTKNEAENIFKEEYKHFLIKNKNDKVAIRTEWNNFTDYLCKDGMISEWQYNNWSHPNFCK